MTVIVKTGAAPYSDGSGFAVDIEIHEYGDIWLNGGDIIVTPVEWDATVEAVARARAAFAILTPTQPPNPTEGDDK